MTSSSARCCTWTADCQNMGIGRSWTAAVLCLVKGICPCQLVWLVLLRLRARLALPHLRLMRDLAGQPWQMYDNRYIIWCCSQA